MKRSIVFIAILAFGITAFGQMKIGYANLEFILKSLPEAQQMNTEVENYRKKLEEQIAAKQDYYQSLLSDYYQKKEQGYAESLLSSMETQILQLEQEIQADAVNADNQLIAMQTQKLEPLTIKITEAVNKVYEEGGYTYIFNSADGTGNSIVLKGPEADNLTFVILKELGVEYDQDE